jgi:RHS repeat-associated protein
MRDWRGKTKYEYDAFNRLKKVTEPDDKWIGYNYDLNNNRISMTDHFGGNTTYSYYDNGLLHELTDRASGLTHYEYWDNGLLKKMTYPNGAYAEYTYHAQRNWLVSLNHYKLGGTVLIAGFTYEYDPTYWGKNGTRTAMEENVLLPGEASRIQSRVDYTYDNVYRLTGEARTGSLSYTKSYTYDDIGNRLTKVENLTTTYYHYDYQYTNEHGQKLRDYGPWDIPGDLRNTVVSYDSAGNTVSELSAGILTEYGYNYQNLMTSVTVGGSTTAQFTYDGDDLRRSAVFASGTTLFLYDRRELIAELDGPSSLKAFYTLGSGERLSRQAGTVVGYYHADGLGSVKAMTSQSPVSVNDAYTYDAWGGELTHLGATEQPYHYVGALGYYMHYQQIGISFVHLGRRYYTPRNGRFMTADPIKDELVFYTSDIGWLPSWALVATAQLYAYADNRPTALVDPDGLLAGRYRSLCTDFCSKKDLGNRLKCWVCKKCVDALCKLNPDECCSTDKAACFDDCAWRYDEKSKAYHLCTWWCEGRYEACLANGKPFELPPPPPVKKPRR